MSFHPRSSVTAVSVAAVLAFALAGCEPEATPLIPPPTVAASVPLQRDVTGWDTFTGRFEAVDMVDVRARVGGYVEQVAFHDGDIVGKGDLLFVIDARPYEAAVTQAEGQLAQARSQFELAGKELERAKSLTVTQAISTSVLDQRQQARQAAEAAMTTASGTLSRARLDLEFTRVRAPIAGRISRKLVSEGNLVAGGDAGATLLTTIVSLDRIDVYFDIDEESYLRYGRLARDGKRATSANLGSKVQIALPGDAEPMITGELDFVENRLDGSTGTLRARARVANPGHTLNPGQFARVSIIGDGPHPALLVPASAVTTDATRQVLYVIGEDDQIIARPVALGRLFGKLREITDGLQSTDKVVVSGLQRAQPGTKVTARIQSIDPLQFASMGE